MSIEGMDMAVAHHFACFFCVRVEIVVVDVRFLSPVRNLGTMAFLCIYICYFQIKYSKTLWIDGQTSSKIIICNTRNVITGRQFQFWLTQLLYYNEKIVIIQKKTNRTLTGVFPPFIIILRSAASPSLFRSSSSRMRSPLLLSCTITSAI